MRRKHVTKSLFLFVSHAAITMGHIYWPRDGSASNGKSILEFAT